MKANVINLSWMAAAMVAMACWPAAAKAADDTAAAPAVKTLTRAKTSLGVGIGYTLVPARVGAPGTLTLTITTRAEPVTLTVRPDEALVLTSTDLAIGTPQPLQASNRFTIGVAPQRDGLHYVNVFLRAGARSRALAIPVQVGEPQPAAAARAGALQASPNGRRVISVPAQQ